MPTWLTDTIAAARTYAPTFLIPAGLFVAALVLGLLVRALRRSSPDKIAVRVAVLLASAFSAQGMFEVATKRLDLPWWLASGLFAVGEAAMLASAVRAHRHWEATKTDTEPGRLGPNGRFVWIIAFCAGGIVCLNSKSVVEFLLRLLMPLLVAGLWWMDYVTEKTKRKAAEKIAFVWSPRRIGIRLGLIEPGDQDLVAINIERQTRNLTTHAHAVHHGLIVFRWWHSARLRKLTLLSDDDMVAEVQRRVNRVHYIETSTAPTIAAADASIALSSGWWLNPFGAARRTALAAASIRAEFEATRAEFEAARLASAAEAESTRLEHLASLEAARGEANRLASEAARVTQEAAEAIRHLRREASERLASVEAEATAREATARGEAEAKTRLAFEVELASLRDELQRAREASPRSPQARNERGLNRPASQRVDTITSDEQVASNLLDAYSERIRLGITVTSYWVKKASGCGTNQADRVLIRLASRYDEARREANSASPQRDASEATEAEPERIEATA